MVGKPQFFVLLSSSMADGYFQSKMLFGNARFWPLADVLNRTMWCSAFEWEAVILQGKFLANQRAANGRERTFTTATVQKKIRL